MEEETITNEPELIKNFSLKSFKSLFDSLKNMVQTKTKNSHYTIKMVPEPSAFPNPRVDLI